MECVKRELNFDLGKKEHKLDLLRGLAAILLDIDEAIRIIRNTEKEADVVPNLAKAFNLNTAQAEYVAEIKLRNINREYILKRVEEIKELEKSIAEIKEILRDEIKLKQTIISSLQTIKKTYGQDRKTVLVEKAEVVTPAKDIFFENYNCRLVLTRGGYFKKLSVQAARAAEEHKMKEGDFIIYEEDTDNRGDVLFFTDKGQIYRSKVSDFDLCKASSMGDYVPMKLQMEDDEHVVGCKMIYELIPEHNMVYIFENGKGLRVSMSKYEAKSKRKKISGAYSSASPLVGAIYEPGKPKSIFIRGDNGKGMLIKTDTIEVKETRTAAGVQVMQFPRKKGKVELVTDRIEELGDDALKCRKNVIPSIGVSIAQLTFKF
jgi:DNA gyrase subunit A